MKSKKKIFLERLDTLAWFLVLLIMIIYAVELFGEAL